MDSCTADAGVCTCRASLELAAILSSTPAELAGFVFQAGRALTAKLPAN